MTVEFKYAIVIATVSDWLNSLAPFFDKPKHIAPCKRDLSRAWSQMQVIIARNSDWFMARFTPVVIGSARHLGVTMEWTNIPSRWKWKYY